ncbi:ras-domain-containing protein [Gigaspora margarita]|uniref:Ras-domain-containing protein n=1 Tax=Gigaspora margarita TaxID=4874 RepID=A0A8H4B2B7_GIGMA|nr:ras-domain-containing protein [Gigaspora margarita]
MTQSKSASYDCLINLLLIGDSGVGKSTLLLRFSNDSFTLSYVATIGIDREIRTIELDAYYRGATGIALVYDVTDEWTFKNIRKWHDLVYQQACEGVNKILLGIKCDLVEKRVITKEQGQALADEFGIKFLEVSAKANINVEEAFFTLARRLKLKILQMQSQINCETAVSNYNATTP